MSLLFKSHLHGKLDLIDTVRYHCSVQEVWPHMDEEDATKIEDLISNISEIEEKANQLKTLMPHRAEQYEKQKLEAIDQIERKIKAIAKNNVIYRK